MDNKQAQANTQTNKQTNKQRLLLLLHMDNSFGTQLCLEFSLCKSTNSILDRGSTELLSKILKLLTIVIHHVFRLIKPARSFTLPSCTWTKKKLNVNWKVLIANDNVSDDNILLIIQVIQSPSPPIVSLFHFRSFLSFTLKITPKYLQNYAINTHKGKHNFTTKILEPNHYIHTVIMFKLFIICTASG